MGAALFRDILLDRRHAPRKLACDVAPDTLRRMSAVIEPDHARAAHAHQVAIYRAMTPEQRLHVALGMNRTVRELMALGFRGRNPAWTEAEVSRAVADRILYARTG